MIDFKDAVMDITNGVGVNVVYDGVGKNALKSLECLSPLGMLVVLEILQETHHPWTHHC